MAEIKLTSHEKIHLEIAEKLQKGVSYIDALVAYAKEKDIEVEVVGEIVRKSSVIKEKIREEAEKLRLVKKEESIANLFE
jgi:hypothetical protein